MTVLLCKIGLLNCEYKTRDLLWRPVLIFMLWLIHREEQEKLNVWIALMNLENLYGTQESLVKVFERALQHNEPKKIFFQLIGIYTRTDKFEVWDST